MSRFPHFPAIRRGRHAIVHRQARLGCLKAAPLGRGKSAPPIEEHCALVEIKPLSQVADDQVELLLDAAFGPDRFARTAYRVRAGTIPVALLSLAAFDGGKLVGCLQCWPVCWQGNDGGIVPLVMVGPVAVQPVLQRGGIGRLMMRHMLAAADNFADGALMMIGDPEYYGRFFGFSSHSTGAWQMPGPVEPRRLLARTAGSHAVPTGAGTIGPRRSP